MLDKKLDLEKEKYMNMKAPEDMEEKLSRALDKTEKKKNYIFPKVASLVVIIALLVGMNSNSIASFIKGIGRDEKIIEEYGEIIPESLKAFEKDGIIQNISKKIELDGKDIVVDGIIVDSLGVNIFVDKEEDSYERLELIDGEKSGNYKTLLSSGRGLIKDEGGRELWNYYFRGGLKNNRITLDFVNKENNNKTIEIDIDEDIRIEELEKLNINKKIRVGGLNYNIQKIYITPINILLEGYNENIIETGLRTIFDARKDYDGLDINLIINGERVEESERGYKSDLSGKSFEYRYNNFPKDIDTLEIEVIDGDNIVDRIKVK